MNNKEISNNKGISKTVEARHLSFGKTSIYLNSILINFAFGTRKMRFGFIKYLKTNGIAFKFSKLSRINSMKNTFSTAAKSERGDVPGWVLVVLMTTGLVTGIWTVAQPRLSSILKNSLDNMNGIR
jgi:flagellar biosynthesis protein FlhB